MASDIVREVDQAIVDAIPQPRRVFAPCKWFGGKGNLARWVVRHLPRDGVQVYCEPYAGMASVLWHLPQPYPVEVLNDLDERIVTLFRVLQDEGKFKQLAHRLIWTPYARAEFERAVEMLQCWDDLAPVDRAWAFFTALNQGFGGRVPESGGNWGRTFVVNRGMAQQANIWRGHMKLLAWWHDRLTRIQIDCRDALDVIRYWDRGDTLFYIDPPYVPSTRSNTRYTIEADESHHEALVDTLLAIRGRAVVSGYDHPIYRRLEAAGWRRVERETACHAAGRVRGSKLLGDGAAKRHARRVEVLWLHPRIPVQGDLYAD